MLPGFRRLPWFTPSHHLLHVLKGGCHYRVGDRTHRLTASDLLLIPPGVWSQSWNPSAETMRYRSIHFDLQYHGDYESLPASFQDEERMPRVHLPPETVPALRLPSRTNVGGQAQIDLLFARVIQETAEKRPGYELATKAATLELLLLLHRGPSEGVEPREERSQVEAIQRAVRFLENNFSRSLSLDDIAGAVHLSPIYFGRLFRKATGVTPMTYLRGLRMDRAAQLLCSGEQTIAQVADAVGFADPYHFSRVFRQHMGMAPSDYRERASTCDPALLPLLDVRHGGYDSFAGVSFYSIPPTEGADQG
jgi:AraC-like DNA-binding protein